MIGSKLFVAVSTLLVASSSFISAEECSPEVSATFVAAITNSTYLNTCAKDATYNLTSVFDVLNLTDAQMLTFCSSDVCLEPIHELMGSLNCNITYEGTPRNLSSEVSKLHDKCHDVVDAAAAANGTHTKDSGNDSTPDSTTPPASGTSSLALTLGSVVSAAIVAAFLA